MFYAPVLKYIGGWNILMINNKLTLSIKEASMISGMPESFIRKQVENGVIPKCYSINHKYRRVFVIFRRPFLEWLKEIRS